MVPVFVVVVKLFSYCLEENRNLVHLFWFLGSKYSVQRPNSCVDCLKGVLLTDLRHLGCWYGRIYDQKVEGSVLIKLN